MPHNRSMALAGLTGDLVGLKELPGTHRQLKPNLQDLSDFLVTTSDGKEFLFITCIRHLCEAL